MDLAFSKHKIDTNLVFNKYKIVKTNFIPHLDVTRRETGLQFFLSNLVFVKYKIEFTALSWILKSKIWKVKLNIVFVKDKIHLKKKVILDESSLYKRQDSSKYLFKLNLVFSKDKIHLKFLYNHRHTHVLYWISNFCSILSFLKTRFI